MVHQVFPATSTSLPPASLAAERAPDAMTGQQSLSEGPEAIKDTQLTFSNKAFSVCSAFLKRI